MILKQLFTRVDTFIDEFNQRIKQFQNILHTIQTNLHHHQENTGELAQPLQNQLIQDMANTQTTLVEVNQIQKTYILTPPEIHKVYELRQSLENQEIMIQFFQAEFSDLLRGNTMKERLLLIKEKPVSHVVFKGKAIEDRYVIQLVTSLPDSLMQSHKDTKIIATVCTEDNNPFKGKNVLSGNSTTLTTDKLAVFQGMKALVSTRMSLVHLFFELKNKANVTLASTLHEKQYNSNIIVITNESQWCEAQGKLITQDCFQNSVSIFFVIDSFRDLSFHLYIIEFFSNFFLISRIQNKYLGSLMQMKFIDIF